MMKSTGHDKRGRAPEEGANQSPLGSKAEKAVKVGLSNRGINRRSGQRGKRFAPAASPSTMVAESYRLGALSGTPAQRLDFFGQAGRLETLKKGLALMSPRMTRRLRRRSVEHMKMLAIAQEFAKGEERTGRTR
jgi:hypothetical protein